QLHNRKDHRDHDEHWTAAEAPHFAFDDGKRSLHGYCRRIMNGLSFAEASWRESRSARPVKCTNTSSSVVLWTESELTVMPARPAASMSASVVTGPLLVASRKMLSWLATSSTAGKVASVCSQLSEVDEKLASSMFLPGTEALSFIGESSALSSPWSTIAMRSQSLSAS